MLENFLRPNLIIFSMSMEQKMCGFNKMVQQPTHLILGSEFSEKYFLGIGYPPRSPDLTMCNFFLWGYLRAQVYQHRPQTFEGLTEAIAQEVAAIPPVLTRRVMEKYQERLNQRIDNVKAAIGVV
jgi:hypothetical protein